MKLKLTDLQKEIMALVESRAMKPTQMIKETGKGATNISRALVPLKAKGYIETLRGTDGRERYYMSTQKYEAELAE